MSVEPISRTESVVQASPLDEALAEFSEEVEDVYKALAKRASSHPYNFPVPWSARCVPTLAPTLNPEACPNPCPCPQL